MAMSERVEAPRGTRRSRPGAGIASRPAGGGSAGRFVSQAERAAAARARVSADRKRGVQTAAWIVELASSGD